MFLKYHRLEKLYKLALEVATKLINKLLKELKSHLSNKK